MASIDDLLQKIEAAYWPSFYASNQTTIDETPSPHTIPSTLPKKSTLQSKPNINTMNTGRLSQIEQMYAAYDQDPSNYKRSFEEKIDLVGIDCVDKSNRSSKRQSEVNAEERSILSAKLLREIREFRKGGERKRNSTPACLLKFRMEEMASSSHRRFTMPTVRLGSQEDPNTTSLSFDLEVTPSLRKESAIGSSVLKTLGPLEMTPIGESREKSARKKSRRSGDKRIRKLSLREKLNLYYDDEHMAKLFGVMSIPERDTVEEDKGVQNFHDMKKAKLNEQENQAREAVQRWKKEADAHWSSLEEFIGAPATASHYWHHLRFCKRRFKTPKDRRRQFRRARIPRASVSESAEKEKESGEPVFNFFTNRVAFASLLKFRRRLGAIRAARAQLEAI